MKILIADKFPNRGISGLTSLGLEVVYRPETDQDQLAEVISEIQPQILIVRGTRVSAQAIAAGTGLSLIVRAGAGCDSIDVSAASARGINVSNCPGKNAVAVAELVWGLILSCDRRLPDQTVELRRGMWNKSQFSQARGLKGRTLGIVGMGQIGTEVAKRGLAFEMEILGWSRNFTPHAAERLGVKYCADLLELAQRADVVSIHLAANPDTNLFIGSPFIEKMKPGAILINTSRGSVLDQDALHMGIEQKGLRAGLDVFAKEPAGGTGCFNDPIVNSTGVYGTHHVGASTDQAQQAIATEAVRVIRTYLESGEVENCVNIARSTTATWMITIRHMNKPGVLAHVFRILGESENNVEQMQNIIYDGSQAACAKIQLDGSLSADDVARIRQQPDILGLELSQLN